MSAIDRSSTSTGTWKNGQIVLDGPAEWPEGCRLLVEPVFDQAETLGITEEEWPRSPEAIAEWLEWFDSIEPIEITPDEEANWQAARAAQKAYQLAKFEERTNQVKAHLP
jgi:hypothetical protein